jgi:hypothetical protein
MCSPKQEGHTSGLKALCVAFHRRSDRGAAGIWRRLSCSSRRKLNGDKAAANAAVGRRLWAVQRAFVVAVFVLAHPRSRIRG